MNSYTSNYIYTLKIISCSYNYMSIYTKIYLQLWECIFESYK